MNIHLPAIFMWTTGVQGFDPLPHKNRGWIQNLALPEVGEAFATKKSGWWYTMKLIYGYFMDIIWLLYGYNDG